MDAVQCYQIDLPLAEAEKAVREALAREGFGILTEVDVQATLKNKLGVDSEPYRLLGACNPSIAHRALTADERVGAFLPCGIALYEHNGTTSVCLQDPGIIGEMFTTNGLTEPAAEARRKLTAALTSVGSPR
jgi:uncharacterized protein (DUF302 family)